MRICVVAGSRADYDLLAPVALKLQSSPNFELTLVITGGLVRSSDSFGEDSTKSDGLRVYASIAIVTGPSTGFEVSSSLGNAVIEFSDFFAAVTPDMVLVLGDRYEIFGVAAAAVTSNIPIAHIHGGEKTVGSLDDIFRHCITKMSSLHFVSAEQYKRRVLQLGENPSMVFNVGSLGVENALNAGLLSKSALERELDFQFRQFNVLVTYHPDTTGLGKSEWELCEILEALTAFGGAGLIFTAPNIDAGGADIERTIINFCKKNDRASFYHTMGRVKYLSAVHYSDVVLGNSSSGIYEAPSMGTRTINVGSRQQGRIMGPSVQCVDANAKSLLSALNGIKQDISMGRKADFTNPYSGGDTSSKIVDILDGIKASDLMPKKEFVDWD